ncbi:MAG TPA: hypothetical protein QGF58_18450 [Myxococcota bacterium]|nr:hypothetical protein [Myxococcota bacterium]
MSNRLQDIQVELRSILDARLAELTKVISETEKTTRDIVSAELEIARTTQAAEGLESEAERLKKDAASIRARTADITKSHSKRVEERDLLKLELEGLEKDGSELRKEVTSLEKKVKRAEERSSKLAADKDNLESKLKELREQIAKMKKLKADLMSSMRGNMSELTGGD